MCAMLYSLTDEAVTLDEANMTDSRFDFEFFDFGATSWADSEEGLPLVEVPLHSGEVVTRGVDDGAGLFHPSSRDSSAPKASKEAGGRVAPAASGSARGTSQIRSTSPSSSAGLNVRRRRHSVGRRLGGEHDAAEPARTLAQTKKRTLLDDDLGDQDVADEAKSSSARPRSKAISSPPSPRAPPPLTTTKAKSSAAQHGARLEDLASPPPPPCSSSISGQICSTWPFGTYLAKMVQGNGAEPSAASRPECMAKLLVLLWKATNCYECGTSPGGGSDLERPRRGGSSTWSNCSKRHKKGQSAAARCGGPKARRARCSERRQLFARALRCTNGEARGAACAFSENDCGLVADLITHYKECPDRSCAVCLPTRQLVFKTMLQSTSRQITGSVPNPPKPSCQVDEP